MSIYAKLGLFVGGALFGSLGIKALTSKDAKKANVHVTAAGLRAKDYVMENVTKAQEGISDIVAEAKDINEARKQAEAAAEIEELALEDMDIDDAEEKVEE